MPGSIDLDRGAAPDTLISPNPKRLLSFGFSELLRSDLDCSMRDLLDGQIELIATIDEPRMHLAARFELLRC
jgi:hypothetical protein